MPIVQSDNRYYIVSGGRGSGKSFSVNALLVMLTYEQGHTILFTRYTLTSAYISIIPEFIDKLEQFGSIADFHITKDEILNKKTGSKIIFRGIKTSSGDQTANLKSLQGITTWVVDEAEELLHNALSINANSIDTDWELTIELEKEIANILTSKGRVAEADDIRRRIKTLEETIKGE